MNVSVIVPTYNRAHLVTETIDSILSQTFADFELILVDNYSSDNTEEVVKSYTDERIRYFKHQNNGVIAVNRNYAIRKAQGEYIAFCDDDDLWFPEKLEIQVKYSCAHPEYYLVYSNAWIFDENGVLNGLCRKPRSFKEGEVFEELVKYNFIPQLTVLIKGEVFENIGFFNEDPSQLGAEDYQYWLRTALYYKIGFVGEPLAMCREHPGRASHGINSARLNQKVFSSLIDGLSIPNKNKVIEAIYESYYQSALYYLKNSDKSAAKNEFKIYLTWCIRNLKVLNLFKNMLNIFSITLKYCMYAIRGKIPQGVSTKDYKDSRVKKRRNE